MSLKYKEFLQIIFYRQDFRRKERKERSVVTQTIEKNLISSVKVTQIRRLRYLSYLADWQSFVCLFFMTNLIVGKGATCILCELI